MEKVICHAETLLKRIAIKLMLEILTEVPVKSVPYTPLQQLQTS